MNTQVNAVDEAMNAFKAVLKTLKDNKVMVDTRKDGIYIRLADGREGGAFTYHWANIFPFETKLQSKQQLSTDIDESFISQGFIEFMQWVKETDWPASTLEIYTAGYKLALQTANKEQGLLEDLKHTIKRQKVIIAKAAMIIDTLQTGGSASGMIDTWKFMQAKAGK